MALASTDHNPTEMVLIQCAASLFSSLFPDQGLNRTLFSIYRKIRRMYDTRNYVGRFTKEEEERLMELYEEFGGMIFYS